MTKELTVSAVYSFLDELLKSIKTLKENSVTEFTVYSPIPDHKIEAALGKRPSPVKYFTLTGALAGFISGFSLSFFTAAKWGLITGGKPYISLWPFIVIGFELTILFGAIATLIGFIVNAKLPRMKKPKGYNDKFSEDKFGITVKTNEEDKDKIISMLTANGAEEVDIEY